ncbi:hypothetical protein BH11PLA1_BH11PLA1_02950 [soil metagenome]
MMSAKPAAQDNGIHPPAVALEAGKAAPLLNAVAEMARASGAFESVEATPTEVVCAAQGPEDEAHYRLAFDAIDASLRLALTTPARYLSQSIEQELVHTGDKLHDLLRDEMIDADHPAPAKLTFEHFRDPEKRYTFRVRVPAADAALDAAETARRVWLLLKAFEATFRELGGMKGGEDD